MEQKLWKTHDELRDIYNAESQLLKTLMKMAKAVTAWDLRSGFENHLKQSRQLLAGCK
jgi:ferritin-like metal-binding protein YciE